MRFWKWVKIGWRLLHLVSKNWVALLGGFKDAGSTVPVLTAIYLWVLNHQVDANWKVSVGPDGELQDAPVRTIIYTAVWEILQDKTRYEHPCWESLRANHSQQLVFERLVLLQINCNLYHYKNFDFNHHSTKDAFPPLTLKYRPSHNGSLELSWFWRTSTLLIHRDKILLVDRLNGGPHLSLVAIHLQGFEEMYR